LLPLQNEISEVFDKLHVSGNDSAVVAVADVAGTADTAAAENHNDSSPKPAATSASPTATTTATAQKTKAVIKARTLPRKLNNGTSSNHACSNRSNNHMPNEEWNSLAQFEKFIKLEMENLTKSNGHIPQPVSTTAAVATKLNNSNNNNSSNLLKPEKHVRDF